MFVVNQPIVNQPFSLYAVSSRTMALRDLLQSLAVILGPPTLILAHQHNSATSYRVSKITNHRETEENRIKEVLDTDDQLASKLQAGDLVVFDRDCFKCAASPLACLGCYSQKLNLVPGKRFDHVGVIISNPFHSIHFKAAFNSTAMDKQEKGSKYAPYVLEISSGAGVRVTPFVDRVKVSSSKGILILPLSAPGERRGEINFLDDDDDDDDDDENRKLSSKEENAVKMKTSLAQSLEKFAIQSMAESQNLSSSVSSLVLLGSFKALISKQFASDSAFDAMTKNTIPANPSAFFVLQALQRGGAGCLDEFSTDLTYKIGTSDLLRDQDLGNETTTNQRGESSESKILRPGWRFNKCFIVR